MKLPDSRFHPMLLSVKHLQIFSAQNTKPPKPANARLANFCPVSRVLSGKLNLHRSEISGLLNNVESSSNPCPLGNYVLAEGEVNILLLELPETPVSGKSPTESGR